MKVKELTRNIIDRLTPTYGEGEARWMMRIIMEHIKGYSPVDIELNGDRDLGEGTVSMVNGIVCRLLKGEPLQYITGRARFSGMELTVTPAVLIPRPETEQLVDIIVDRERDKTDLRVADLGTGSGCIAVALARNLPFSKVMAVDISDEALKVAQLNATNLKAKINFLKGDILSMTLPAECLDIIVSNPPYIVEREKAEMSVNVLDYEPARALFVPNDDPLLFYHAIERIALTALTPGGRLYLELNPLYANQFADELKTIGWQNVDVVLDERGRRRFITAFKEQ